jgi:hypothetical protein
LNKLNKEGDLSMEKELFIKIRKSLAISLLSCFVISVTAAAVSADLDPNWGEKSIKNYNDAYKNAKSSGRVKGIIAGKKDGDSDCKEGLDKGGDSTKGHKSYSSETAQSIGRVDGFNDAYDAGYNAAYNTAYDSCINSNEGNTRALVMKNP